MYKHKEYTGEVRALPGGRRRLLLMWCAILLSALVLCLSLYQVLKQYEYSVLKGQTDQMQALTASVVNNIETSVDNTKMELITMSAAILRQDLTRQQIGGLMLEAIAHRQGSLRMAEYIPETGEPLLTDPESGWREVLSFQDDEVFTTSLVQSDEGQFCLRVSRHADGVGSLSLYMDMRSLYENSTSYIELGEKSYIMLKDSTGRILGVPDTDLVGRRVTDVIREQAEAVGAPAARQLEALSSTIGRQLAAREGTEVYFFYEETGDEPVPARKISSYKPVMMGGGFLVVSTILDYQEISAPIQRGALRILLIASILALMLFTLVLVFYRQMVINRRMKLENLRLTEMRQQEEILNHRQRLQLIGTMATGIAHEFNNLLTPIMGYAALVLAETPAEDSRYNDLKEIYDSTERAKEIITQFTQFSGKNVEKTYRKIDLTQVLTKSLQMVDTVKPRTVTLRATLPPVECLCIGNPTHIQQIILNLCTNSIQAMEGQPEGLLQIFGAVIPANSLRDPFFRGKGQKLYFRLSVTDNGCGISPDMVDRIFVPFTTARRNGEGTGLGLPIVKQIVDRHDGLITVTGTPGKGTTFELYLPLCDPSEDA